MTHTLKIDPIYFQPVLDRKKTFEVRFNDRNYQVGDAVVLQEYDRKTDQYTGRSLSATITYVTSHNQLPHFVVFSISF